MCFRAIPTTRIPSIGVRPHLKYMRFRAIPMPRVPSTGVRPHLKYMCFRREKRCRRSLISGWLYVYAQGHGKDRDQLPPEPALLLSRRKRITFLAMRVTPLSRRERNASLTTGGAMHLLRREAQCISYDESHNTSLTTGRNASLTISRNTSLMTEAHYFSCDGAHFWLE